MNIGSSGLWMYYSIQQDDQRLLVRSGSEVGLLAISSIYIIRNKVQAKITAHQDAVAPRP